MPLYFGPRWGYGYDPYYDYPRHSRTVVIEREARRAEVEPGPPPAQYWYYCDSAEAYYPYVNSCAEGWREVPATPPVLR
jgi:hypothetical protein